MKKLFAFFLFLSILSFSQLNANSEVQSPSPEWVIVHDATTGMSAMYDDGSECLSSMIVLANGTFYTFYHAGC